MKLVIHCEMLFMAKDFNEFLSNVNISRGVEIFIAIILEFSYGPY